MQFKKSDEGKAKKKIGERDIRSVFTLLAIQCMILLGEIPDPLAKKPQLDLPKARLYFGLLEILREKTAGKLTRTEEQFLQDLIDNLSKIIAKKKRK